MPLPLAQKHLFYTELAKLLEAGFGVREAAGVMADSGIPARQKAILTRMESGLDAGETITEAFGRNGAEISPLEKSIIGAGERGGRLAPAFQHLADYYDLLSGSRKQAVNALMYPLFMLHLGVIVAVLIPGLSGDLSAAKILLHIVEALALVYLGIALIGVAVRTLLKAAQTQPGLDAALNVLPGVGAARRSLAMARFTKVYHICVLAGLSISESAKTAADSAQSGVIRQAGAKLAATAQAGDRLGPVMSATGAFPKSFARSYATAEEAGGLDRDLARWAGVYQEDSRRAMQTLASLFPKVCYLLIMIFIAYEIISFYMHSPEMQMMKEMEQEN